MPASISFSANDVATISLPHLLCATPRSAQNAYSIRRPCTQNRAIRLSFG